MELQEIKSKAKAILVSESIDLRDYFDFVEELAEMDIETEPNPVQMKLKLDKDVLLSVTKWMEEKAAYYEESLACSNDDSDAGAADAIRKMIAELNEC